MTQAQAETHDVQPQRFQAEVTQVLRLVIDSLYSNKDVFLRELVSNAADALDKLRFSAIEKPELLPPGYVAKVQLIPDEQARTLTISDSGIGMSREALARDLGTVARSGSKELLAQLAQAQAQHDMKLIGRFGVGFYSGYLVADRIDVISRAAGSDEAWKWSSDGKETFTVEPAERESIGTSVVLHLSADHADYSREHTLRELVSRYSDFISYPIELAVTRSVAADKDDSSSEGTEPKKETRFEAINKASALWMRAEKDVTDAQYEELYKHLTHDWEPPLARAHFHVEGTQMFTGLLYLPKRPPFDLSNPEWRHGVRLYVRRVFIMDQCEELLPRWLRFVRGVIDSDDLPLNVSRELLQDSALVRTIRKQVTRRVLDMLGKLATDKPDEYLGFFQSFGPVLKEGLHFEPTYADKIAPLLRYESSKVEGFTSLAEYKARMVEGQTKIYYALGPSTALLAASPLLESLKKRGYEVLYMTHGVDQWAIEGLSEFDGVKLVDAMREGQDDALDDKGAASDETTKKELSSLLSRCKDVLSAHVSDVRVSQRLTDSPACLVTPMGGVPAHIERLLRAHQQDLPEQKRILELNPSHPVVQRMRELHEKDASSSQVSEWAELLYDQALLVEGSPLPDPARFAKRLSELMETASSLRAQVSA